MNSPFSLRRLPALLLLLALLASQWGWLAHEYQAHDSGQVCELCVAGAQLGHALGATPAQPFAAAPAALLVRNEGVAGVPLATPHSPLQPRAPPLLTV